MALDLVPSGTERLQWVTEKGEAKVCGSPEWIRTKNHCGSYPGGFCGKLTRQIEPSVIFEEARQRFPPMTDEPMPVPTLRTGDVVYSWCKLAWFKTFSSPRQNEALVSISILR